MRHGLLSLAAIAVAAVAHAAPPARAWLGTFQPAPGAVRESCTGCSKRKIQPVAGSVRVLTPGDGSPAPTGDVVIVSPLLGVVAAGKIDQGRVPVAWFHYDLRDSDDGVLVLPAGTPIGLIATTPTDARDIEQALLKNEVLSHVRRALAGIEIGVVDVDGDGKGDFAVTYGCNAWGDGQCQGRGQFFLARRGGHWAEVDDPQLR
jgi:hypothetical protein